MCPECESPTSVDGAVRAEVTYLARDPVFEHEKPYRVAFPVLGSQQSNHVFTHKQVLVQDVRRANSLSLGLDITGFAYLKAHFSLDALAYDDEDKVRNVHYKELEDLIHREFPQYKEVVFLEHTVRKRDHRFPSGHGATVSHSQPLLLAHADYTTKGAYEYLSPIFEESAHLTKRPFEMLNIWHVLRGPNNDWPLAVCDFRTVDPQRDTTPNDIVHPNHVGENRLLHYSPKHKWWYMSSMDVNDVLVMRNADSEGKDILPKSWHVAFDNPAADSEMPRESIEVRIACFL